MIELKNKWRTAVAQALNDLLIELKLETTEISVEQVSMEKPPKAELGDVGFPLFPFAKIFKMGPPVLANRVVQILNEKKELSVFGSAFVVGPYVNVKISKTQAIKNLISTILNEDSNYGKTGSFSGRSVMVEFSSPNTNKPLHLGHLRNDALGESISRILAFCGAKVKKVCIINNRGVHICKSMLAYKKFGNGETPESTGLKSDRFVGDYYVKFAQWEKQDPTAESQAQEMLKAWESGDPEVVALWKQMNEWALSGMRKTYERTGVAFDKYYFESETYLSGKDEIQKGLDMGIFYKDEEGTTWIDLTNEGLDKKVLLRKDGTSVYITQDIGTAIARHNDWPFDQLVYVVGSEQIYHFKVLFSVLKKLGYKWADMLYHLSYGMVNLPEGKMKSREGTVVDADDLINKLQQMAYDEIKEKKREEEVGDASLVAEKIAIAALHYFLLQVSPSKDMVFNPKESLSFAGNTGPYLQYVGARISSVLRKIEGSDVCTQVDYNALSSESEWSLVKILGEFPNVVDKAAKLMDPSQIAVYLYDLCKEFSRFYHDCPILSAEDEKLKNARLALSKSVLVVLKNAMNLILIPYLEKM